MNYEDVLEEVEMKNTGEVLKTAKVDDRVERDDSGEGTYAQRNELEALSSLLRQCSGGNSRNTYFVNVQAQFVQHKLREVDITDANETRVEEGCD